MSIHPTVVASPPLYYCYRLPIIIPLAPSTFKLWIWPCTQISSLGPTVPNKLFYGKSVKPSSSMRRSIIKKNFQILKGFFLQSIKSSKFWDLHLLRLFLKITHCSRPFSTLRTSWHGTISTPSQLRIRFKSHKVVKVTQKSRRTRGMQFTFTQKRA